MISTLASAYAVSGEARYRAAYERYQSAWLDTYKISGNPIDETGLSQWLLAYHVAGDALPPARQRQLQEFACRLSARYQQKLPAHRKTTTNNWQSHRVKLALMGGLICLDPELIERAIALFKEQIRNNLLASGPAIDFFERDAIHYVVYSVEPLLEAATLSRQYGAPVFQHSSPDGQSISRTLEWLAPYARGELKHEEFVHSSVRFDAERAAAGVSGFFGKFSPEKMRHMYWLAARLDQCWSVLSQSLGEPWVTYRAPWLAE